MKIRLMQPGFENFTGPMGRLVFEDGLSTTDVEGRDFLRMSSVMKCEREDGTSASPVDALLAIADVGAPTAEVARAEELERNADALKVFAQPEADRPATDEPALPVAALYTEEQLGKIADKKGIKGLREIAEPMGIKGNSIKELIAEILQGPKVEG
jgi:hypothetical protein